MKLLKKLLPIATLASTAAVVAPIITSCGNSGINLYKKYNVTIPKYAKTEVESEEKGVELYFTAASANPEIIVQDYYWTVCKDTEFPSGVSASGSVKVSNIKVDTTNKVFSFNFEEHASASGEAEGTKGEEKTDVSYSVSNIPYLGYYDSFSKKWVFSVDPDLTKWKTNTKVEGSIYVYVKVNGTVKQDTNTGKQTITKTTDITKADEKLQLVYGGLNSVNWTSYHFTDVTIKE